jgi:transglutaminase-like putative cysteine protease
MKPRKPEQQVLVVAAAVVVSGAISAWQATPRPSGLSAAASYGLTWLSWWHRILTTTVPVPPTPDRLPVVGVTTSLAAAIAVLSATRTRPGLRPLGPAVSLFVVALALGAGGPGSLVAVTTPFIGGAAIYLLTIANRSPRGTERESAGRWAAAALSVLVVLAVVVGTGQRLPLAGSRNPLDPGQFFTRTVDLSAAPNPLNQLSAARQSSPSVVFTARIDRNWLAAPAGWRLVTLDNFDGATWTWSAAPVRVGTVLAPHPPSVGEKASVDLTINRLSGPWVPTTGIPLSAQPPKLAYDPRAAMLVDEPSVRGHRYHLQVGLPLPATTALGEAAVATGRETNGLTSLPGCVPPELHALAANATRGLVQPYAEAQAIARVLSTAFTTQSDSSGPDSCDQLKTFTEEKAGPPDVFTAAFAVMARSLGLPTRLAVGFRPGELDPGAGQVTVRSTDAAVWPEVLFAGLGWIPFNPATGSGAPTAAGASGTAGRPATGQSGSPLMRPPQPAPATSITATSPPSTVPRKVPAPSPRPAGHSHAHGPLGGWWALLAVALALMVVYGAPRFGRDRRREKSRRARRADPAARAMGAWEELLDHLKDRGIPVATLTPSEIADTVTWVAPAATMAIRKLALLVDAIVYGDATVSVAVAGDAWDKCYEATRSLQRSASTADRVRSAVHSRHHRTRTAPPRRRGSEPGKSVDPDPRSGRGGRLGR